MKRLLLASVGLVALGIAVPASAADLPRRGPAVAPVAVAPIYNWTGFYIGGHIGWAHSELDATLSQDFFPFTAGTNLSGGGNDSFLGGGQVGFNYQVGQFVFGVEGQFSWTDAGRDATIFIGPNSVTASTDVNWVATIAARFGVAFGNALFYGKGGIAFLDWGADVTFAGPAVQNGTVSFGNTETGWMVGVGLEYGFAPNWSAAIEYDHLFMQDRTYTFVTPGGILAGNDRIRQDVDLVTVRVNYRWGGPVIAKY